LPTRKPVEEEAIEIEQVRGNASITMQVGSVHNPVMFSFSAPHIHVRGVAEKTWIAQLWDLAAIIPSIIEKLNAGRPEIFAEEQNLLNIASDYTATDEDYMILCNAVAAPITVSLPSAIIRGHTFVIVKVDSSGNAVAVTPFGSDKIEADSSKSLTSQFSKCIITADGVSTWIDESVEGT
jgi:hypothetical protein